MGSEVLGNASARAAARLSQAGGATPRLRYREELALGRERAPLSGPGVHAARKVGTGRA